MKHCSPRYYQLLEALLYLPELILELEEEDHLAQLILYNLCSEDCLDISKAAYFIDNPDFDCLKGVAGFLENESELGNKFLKKESLPKEEINKHFSNCEFNKKVKDIKRSSCNSHREIDKELITSLADELGINSPTYYKWKMRHDNLGIILFEKGSEPDFEIDEEILKALCILAFCPNS